MLRKIILENFMSHGRTEMELADGLTVLTGPNNCGKSAVVAALQVLASNGRTTHVTRHGKKLCRITVETDDDHTITWERNGTAVKYTLDGEDIHRVKTGIPDSLHDLLRLDRVHADLGKSNHEYDIHFGQQKSPVFLLDETGSRAASFFASSSDAARLVEMQHVHRANLRDRKTTAKRLTAERTQNADRLTAFAPLDEIAKRVAIAQSQQRAIDAADRHLARIGELIGALAKSFESRTHFQQLQQTLSRITHTDTTPAVLDQDRRHRDRLAEIVNNTRRLIRSRRKLEQSRELLEPLVQPPQLLDVERIRGSIARIEAANQRRSRTRRFLDRCNRLVVPPTQEPAAECRKLLRSLTAESNRRALTAGTVAVLSRLREPPELMSVSRLQMIISELETRTEKLRRTGKAQKILDRLRPQQPKIDTEPLIQMVNRLRQSSEIVATARRKANSASEALDRCEQAIRAHVAAHPTCQTCGGRIDPDTLLTAAPQFHRHVNGGVADE